MSFLVVFIPSLVLTAIVGAFLPLAWAQTRALRVQATYWGFALFVHLAWAAIPRLGAAAQLARWLAIMWFGSMLAAIMLLIPFALLTAWSRRRKLRVSLRLPIIYVTGSLLAGLILSFTSTANFVIRQEEIRIAGLPPALDGFRIANLGDVHVGRFIDSKELERGIRAINGQKVDLLVVTGDLIDDASQLESTMTVLEQLNTTTKIVAILGNHEELGDLPKILSVYSRHRSRIALLINKSMAIVRSGATLQIVGVDFPMNPRGGYMRPGPKQDAAMDRQADEAFAGLPTGETILALSHHPGFFPFAAAHGAQLTLASHTHGAQIQLFGRPLVGGYAYLQGLYRRGDAYLDVSAGFGHWLPIRFGVPREIVIVTLRAEPSP